MSTIRIKTRVLPGGRIELESPEFIEGRELTVEVELEEELPKLPLSEILGDYPGGRMFKTVEDVDRYINEERDSWDR